MLPAMMQFLIAIIACALNEKMQKKLDYTQEEVCVLKEVVETLTGKKRIPFTDEQRRRLARGQRPEPKRTRRGVSDRQACNYPGLV